MTQPLVTLEMTIFEILELVPQANEIFRLYGANPSAQCGPLLRSIRLKEAPLRCGLQDLDELLEELNAVLLKQTQG
jgi:hypothetical protein